MTFQGPIIRQNTLKIARGMVLIFNLDRDVLLGFACTDLKGTQVLSMQGILPSCMGTQDKSSGLTASSSDFRALPPSPLSRSSPSRPLLLEELRPCQLLAQNEGKRQLAGHSSQTHVPDYTVKTCCWSFQRKRGESLHPQCV